MKNQPQAKFIKINHHNIINVNDIKKIEYKTDDMYYGDYKKLFEQRLDYVIADIAEIEMLNGAKYMITMDVFDLEDGQTTEEWSDMYIAKIHKCRKDIESVIDIAADFKDLGYEN